MAVNKDSGEIISLEEAKQYISAFRSRFPEELHGYFVGSDKIQLILEQDGCVGIRIYNGYDEETQTKNVVLVGVDSNGNDMEDGIILEKLIICPPYCSTGTGN